MKISRAWIALISIQALALLSLPGLALAASKPPIVVTVIAEYGLKDSHAAQSIEKGVRAAAEEINAAGGLLDGRKIEVMQRDDRGLPARGVDHLLELADNPNVAAVFCGRFSPVALEMAPIANQKQILLLDPWAAADGITQNRGVPNYVFRLSLTDTWALDAMLQHAMKRKLNRVAAFLPNTAWGRSSAAAIEVFSSKHPRLQTDIYWYNWGDTQFTDQLARARVNGMQALIMVANESEGSMIVKQMAALPPEKRVPIIAHWGIAAGNFASMVGKDLEKVDLVVAQTFTFATAYSARAKLIAEAYRKRYGAPIEEMLAQAGFAHAYDLTHLLAKAIALAGNTNRPDIRAAMENLPAYAGLVRNYKRPFTPTNHEALDRNQVFMGRFLANGTLVPAK
jgi:branched-chain amino acid transport system substrate-binding protein